ncbi:MAG: hypothetical protein PHO55_08780 [Thiomonas arsenitoxydans]|jgi:hypothetical protein|nr:hypothetical protein [Thiomonas arsenitoxydans]
MRTPFDPARERPPVYPLAPPGQSVMPSSRRGDQILEGASSALAIVATVALAWSPGQTHVWMWVFWMVSALGLAAWSYRARAWGVLMLNLTYLGLDVMGLARLLGAL